MSWADSWEAEGRTCFQEGEQPCRVLLRGRGKGDQEPTPTVSRREVTGGLGVSDFQGVVGLSENGRKKSGADGTDDASEDFAAKGTE